MAAWRATKTEQADLLVCDPAVTGRKVLLGLATLPLGLAYLALRLWLEGGVRKAQLPWLFALAVAWGLALALLPLVSVPVWVRAGRHGVAFRDWQRSGSYGWAQIESFEVGNPDDPRLAYVRLRSLDGRVQAVRLPSFQTIDAARLVRRLRERQAQERPSATSAASRR